MNLQQYACVNNINLNIHYISDISMINKYTKDTSSRLLFLDYGTRLDKTDSLFRDLPKGYHCMVFPAVKEGIDWEMFKKNTSEPPDQRGLNFDTQVDKCLDRDIYNVVSTDARIWLLDTKAVKKSSVVLNPSVLKSEIKICADVSCKPVVHYTHECKANILESSGISVV
jgi:hypothetical protein